MISVNFYKKHIARTHIAVAFASVFFITIPFLGVCASNDFDAKGKQITLIDDGLSFEISSGAATVEEFLMEQKIGLSEQDSVLPLDDKKIYSGSKIIIQRAKEITIKESGNIFQAHTLQSTVEQALWENKNFILGEDDVTVPARNMPVRDGMTVVVTHVLIKEEIKNLDIEYKTISNEDDKLGWRVRKVTQKGEKGIKEVKYKVVYNDGREISRKVLESNIIKDPVEEIVTQGTLVKIGKKHEGVASWYAYTGTLSAANPWLPMGSYVRVTNTENGKSVIVKINDRGPFGNGRIIDLDKVAFAQIASIGAGVVHVKMEVITN